MKNYHPLRKVAINLVAKEIRSGRLDPAKSFDCVDCGGPATEYDHRDYSKPLEVDPTCHKCNLARGSGKFAFDGTTSDKALVTIPVDDDLLRRFDICAKARHATDHFRGRWIKQVLCCQE